jgi:hypothetical protein
MERTEKGAKGRMMRTCSVDFVEKLQRERDFQILFKKHFLKRVKKEKFQSRSEGCGGTEMRTAFVVPP